MSEAASIPTVSTRVRPSTVTAAVVCMAASAIVATVLTAAAMVGVYPLPAGASPVSNILTVLFLILVMWGFASGRRWVRWLMVVFYALGSLLGTALFLLKPELRANLTARTIVPMLTQFTLQTLALALLCPAASRDWFRPPKGEG
jgi:hypothetical protein